jgi:hypothetical protein
MEWVKKDDESERKKNHRDFDGYEEYQYDGEEFSNS